MLVPSDGIKRHGDLWVVSFIISPNGNETLIGWGHEVSEYRRKNFPVCYETRLLYFSAPGWNGSRVKSKMVRRALYDGSNCFPVRWKKVNYKEGRKFVFTTNTSTLVIRRPPDHWIPEYDKLLGLSGQPKKIWKPVHRACTAAPVVKQKEEVKNISEFPNICPHCGAPSYNSIFSGSVDCSKKCPMSKR